MPDPFVSFSIDEILVGEPLPSTVYVYIDLRFITFRAEGDVIDRATFERLELKRVRTLFIAEKDRDKFTAWTQSRAKEVPPPLAKENEAFAEAREDARRKALDVFRSQHPDKAVTQAMSATKKLVSEVMKFPFAVQTLSQLQTYSRGTVDHSLNVSILSTYLAMQMGYSHTLILQHVGVGGLLHDVGKTLVGIEEEDDPKVAAEKMVSHPEQGLKLLESQDNVPNEVKMIVAQHHEAHDGSGYPKRLKGGQIYDLARIVSLANLFDELVGDGKGTLVERQRAAIQQLDEVHYRKFDPQKLEKALKILKLGV